MLNQPELIEGLQKKDESAFKTLVEQCQDMVYNTAVGIVQNPEDADDITQEVFVQVYQSISSFKGESKLSTWIYRITVSKALDQLKKGKRKKRFAYIKALLGGPEEEPLHPIEFNHPGVQLERKERAGELFAALKQIPDNQRIAFTLQKLEGLSNREIAEIMNTSLYAVESLMGRAKISLQKKLSGYYRDKIGDH